MLLARQLCVCVSEFVCSETYKTRLRGGIEARKEVLCGKSLRMETVSA